MKRLVQKFEPDFSIHEELSEAEFSCSVTIEEFLLRVSSDNISAENGIDDVGNQADSEAREENTAETKYWRPIEESLPAARLHTIYEHYKSKGRAKCMKKFQISESQLKAVVTNYEEGEGEHVKSVKIRKMLQNKFTQVGFLGRSPCSHSIFHYWLLSPTSHDCCEAWRSLSSDSTINNKLQNASLVHMRKKKNSKLPLVISYVGWRKRAKKSSQPRT